jgi:hypothetical protein
VGSPSVSDGSETASPGTGGAVAGALDREPNRWTEPGKTRAQRLTQTALAGSTAAILVLAGYELAYGLAYMGWDRTIGADLTYYANLARMLFTTGQWFPDKELHGPWLILQSGPLDVLYPPAVAWIFAPFIWLPVGVLLAFVIGVNLWLIREWRSAPWTWPLMALCVLWPLTLLKGIGGTSSLFVMVALGLGLRYRWPSVFILLKPSLFPFALLGIRSKWWWVGLALLGLMSLPFLRETLLYPQVILDSRNPDGALYSLTDLPMMAIPIIAWLGQTRRRPSAINRPLVGRRLSERASRPQP